MRSRRRGAGGSFCLLLAPRMLRRQPGEGRTPPEDLSQRLAALGSGGCSSLLQDAARSASVIPPGSHRQRLRSEISAAARAPRSLKRPLPPGVQAFQPPSPLVLNSACSVSNLRGARRGAAPGPSGATAEHDRILLDDEESTSLLARAAHDLASANARLVTDDVLRRLVCRTLAQQMAPRFQGAPLFSAPSTCASTECVRPRKQTVGPQCFPSMG